jgi:hypothetical protein
LVAIIVLREPVPHIHHHTASRHGRWHDHWILIRCGRAARLPAHRRARNRTGWRADLTGDRISVGTECRTRSGVCFCLGRPCPRAARPYTGGDPR